MRARELISSGKDIFLRRTTQTWLLHRKVLQGQEVPGWEPWAKIAIVLAAIFFVMAGWWAGAFHSVFRMVPYTHLDNLWFSVLVIYGLIYYAALVWRIWLWLGYRPMPPLEEHELPMVSVIIPAYNEGPLVEDSILSVSNSEYPRDKLQVIVVDDGSTDDTWKYIQQAALEAPIKVITIHQSRNRGKRHALYTGFQQANGEVWVTVDSDSILEPKALRQGVSPLVRDQRIGCVSGCVRVLNRNDSLITRFLKTSFSLSFNFSRAYQSQIRGLLTTAGALSLYRASVVKPVLGKWLQQTFLGKPCLTGEDRALTNLITAQGFHSFFQSNAVVWSKMPSRYPEMARMFLRWARSNIRETLVLFSFLFKKFRPDYLWGFRINSLLIASTLVVPYLLMGQGYALLLTKPLWLFRQTAILALFSGPMALIYYRNEGDSDFAWVIAYEFFWVLTCQWIMLYAFLTCRNQGAWITRGVEKGRSNKMADALPLSRKPLANDRRKTIREPYADVV
jgi:hyaluronan synthase